MSGRATNHSYETGHIYLASFLICRGIDLLGTRVDGGGHVFFRFPITPELHSATAAFLADGQVEARKFCFTLLKLKKHIPR